MSVRAILCLLCAVQMRVAQSQEVSPLQFEGLASLEMRIYQHPPALKGQRRHGAALVLQPSVSKTITHTRTLELKLTPYLRLDSVDRAARYFDLREASLRVRGIEDLWRIGVETVNWSVVESSPVINIVNQADTRADVDLEAKLGQPMLSYTRFTENYGRFEAMWLPYFRPRPRVGEAGRQRTELVASDPPPHGLGPWQRTDDFALRWAGTLWNSDVSLYGFKGLSREPDIDQSGSELYRRIRQVGLSVQRPQGSMLWKVEGLRRWGQGRPFLAYTAGGEYTFTWRSAEIGVLGEYLRDRRDPSAPAARFAHGLFAGLRVRFNDAGDSEMLYGVLRDHSGGANLHKLEFSRRLSSHLRLGVVGRKYQCDSRTLYGALCQDSNVQLTITYNF